MIIKALGTTEYETVWRDMQRFTKERDELTPDEIWWTEHYPVFTQGRAGKPEHLIASPGSVPVVKTDRGGQITYHGPGQLVVYPLLNLKRYGIGVRDLVTLIESAIVELLFDIGIGAEAMPDAPGVYVEGRKIASLGLRISRGCSLHGLALNVAMDLSPFELLNPCGYAGLQMTQVEDLQPAQAQLEVLAPKLIERICGKLKH